MLILSQNGEVLYDTRSGCGICAVWTNDGGELRANTPTPNGMGWYLMGKYESLAEAKEALTQLFFSARRHEMMFDLREESQEGEIAKECQK